MTLWGRFDTRCCGVWDSWVSAPSDGESPMNQVPIVRVTELLAQAFGLIVVAVCRHPVTAGAAVAGFTVTDREGAGWLLRVSTSASEQRSRHVVHRWGCYWTLDPIVAKGARTVAVPAVSSGHARVGIARKPPAWNCADGRALERVGSWLAQPAGLPPATDILGQCFMDVWNQHRPHIAAMHARAESLHDALERHPTGSGNVLTDGASDSPANEGFRHQRVLRHLVSSQQILLGHQASAYPMRRRREVLRSLVALLEAERARQGGPDTWWRAG